LNILTKYLDDNFLEYKSFDFYRYIFSTGELEEKGIYQKGKYCGIAVSVSDEQKVKRFSVTDNLEVIEDLSKSNDFCIMSPISYIGKARKSENARFLYALAFDVDGIVISRRDKTRPQGLIDLFYQIQGPAHRIPMPTFVVSSGTGIHVYYVFEQPIPLFRNIVKQLMAYKHEMTRILWQGYITTLEDNVQYESLFQGFRMVGTKTKLNERVRAFKTGDRVTMEYLNEFVDKKFKVTQFSYKSNLSLEEAKEKYPEWYEKRVIKKLPKGYWTTKRDLYDWWKRRILEEAKVGHRYYCMMMLAIYARKAGIEYKELERDAFIIMEDFERLTQDDINHFTESDVLDALEAYNDSYMTYPINSISALTDITIHKNKRNGRKQREHLIFSRGVKNLKKNMGEIENDGRPSKEKIVKDCIIQNPDYNPTQIAKALDISRTTVYKYLK